MLTEVDTPRRRVWERVIWLTDVSLYLVLAFVGSATLWLLPQRVNAPVEWVVDCWGWLLLLGGIAAAGGRLTQWWSIEYVANVAVAWGVLLLGLSLAPTSLSPTGWPGTLGIVAVALGFVIRRYSELKIFTSEPGLDSFRKRLDAALRRRTENTVPRLHY